MSARILAKGIEQSNNSRETGLNNNDLIVGPSGAGKTSGYVIPNMLFSEESKIVVDTKSTLYYKYKNELEEKGYKVKLLDFDNVELSIGYNPFDYVRYDDKTKLYNDLDVMTISRALIPTSNSKEPFWENSARTLLSALAAVSLELEGNDGAIMERILEVFALWGNPECMDMFVEAYDKNEGSLAYKYYKMATKVKGASVTQSCIESFLSESIVDFVSPTVSEIMTKVERVDFKSLSEEKTVLFVSVSDTDRSKDKFFNLFYTQAMQILCKIADQSETKELKIPVRIILDDFAANTTIENFDKITSVIRSRNFSVSIIVQSMTQLTDLYGQAKATTIMNNCDHWLYLGGQDYETANVIARRSNKSIEDILNMPLSQAYLVKRGVGAKRVERFNIYDVADRGNKCKRVKVRSEHISEEGTIEMEI